MRLRNKMHCRAIAFVALLASALAIPGSTAAVPTDTSDLDAPLALHGIDTPAARPLWDQPASPAAVAVSPTPPKQAASKRVPGANPLSAIPLATLSNTNERPIFSPSRRPPPPAVAPVATVAAPQPKPARTERPQLSLVGTISGSEQSFGIFVDESTKAALRLKLGEEYQGWRLRNVAARDVTLEHDEQTAALSLPQPAANAPQPPPEANAPQPIRMQAKKTDDERLQLRPQRSRR
jgi:hypothetical protein